MEERGGEREQKRKKKEKKKKRTTQQEHTAFDRLAWAAGGGEHLRWQRSFLEHYLTFLFHHQKRQ
jgi:hypothetical protein